jgi:hypothetical protein
MAQAHPKQGSYGLRREVLSSMETLAQSVSTIAPTTTPLATIPLVCALAGNGTWQGHNARSPRAERRLLHHSVAGAPRLGRCHSFHDPYETNFTTGTPALPTACGGPNTGFYNCPYGLGNVNKTIGSARQFQFSLHLTAAAP